MLGSDCVRLSGALAISLLQTPLELVRTAMGPPIGTTLPIDLDIHGTDAGTCIAELDLPVALARSGVATTGRADVIADGQVLARVGVGECLASASGSVWCRFPWEEGGREYVGWLAGTLRGGFGNQVYVGRPPEILWSGSWHQSAMRNGEAARARREGAGGFYPRGLSAHGAARMPGANAVATGRVPLRSLVGSSTMPRLPGGGTTRFAPATP